MHIERSLGKRSLRAIALPILLVAVLAACGEEQAPPKEEVRVEPAPAGRLWVRGAGATFPEPLYKKWVETYQANNPDIWVTYSGVGSGAGIDRFITGSVDFGGSDAAMSNEQMARVDSGVHLVPATAGMVVLAYNLPGVDGELYLPRDVYADIFAGKIDKWNDPKIQAANAELALPNLNIALVARRDSSGTTFAFTNHLAEISETFRSEGPGVGKLVSWPAGAMLANGNDGVAQRVKISEGAIGYMGYEFAKRLDIPMATLENKAGNFVKADPATGQTALADTVDEMPENLRLFIPDPKGAGSYPIVTYSWLMLYGQYSHEKKRTAIKDFVTWGLTEGQSFSDDLGFIPLPREVVSLGTRAVERIQ
jgi:phosphate transport system substrate-binding protein